MGEVDSDFLYSSVNPSGKLPITFPRHLSQNPAFLNYRSERGRVLYGEDVYVGYRYYEKLGTQPLFPFGHGLSYTSFQLSRLEGTQLDACSHISPPLFPEQETFYKRYNFFKCLHVYTTLRKLTDSALGTVLVSESELTANCTVENTGDREGAEVVQVYLQQRDPSISRPIKELKGFAKVNIQPGAQGRVSVRMDKKYACSFWDETRDMWVMEKGKFNVLVGNSSQGDFLQSDFVVEKTSWWSGL